MEYLNAHRLSAGYLNASRLGCGALMYGSVKTAFGGYVKDGLVLQLDCAQDFVEYSAGGQTYWKWMNLAYKDGSGVSKYISSAYQLERTDGVVFDGEGYFSNANLGDHTPVIEVCFKINEKNTDYISSIVYSDEDKKVFMIGTSLVTSSNSRYNINNGFVACQYGEVVTIAFNPQSGDVWVNGIKRSYTETELDYLSYMEGVGTNFNGSIYSIRIYDDDDFTNDVASKNYAIDQTRFGKPSNALYDGSGNLLYDGSGNLLLSDN